MNKSDEFIEGRIRWRSGQHNFPFPDTCYWEDMPAEFKSDLNLEVGQPVLVSKHDESSFVVLCTQGLIVKKGSGYISIPYTDIKFIQYSNLQDEFEKSEMYMLDLCLKNGNTQSVKTEKGAAYFSVWGVLLMLVGMN